MNRKLKYLAITCGGTGGHFNPGLSIAQELKAAGGYPVLLLGGRHAGEQIRVAEAKGIPAYKITASPVKSLRFLPELFRGILQSGRILKENKVQALLSMGSYTAIPPFFAAKLKKIPFFLHDGNARLGKSNIAMSRFARAFAFSFPSVNAEKVRCCAVLTGFPLRRDLLVRMSREDAFREINSRFSVNFDPAQPLLLVFGGSQGAEKINANIDFSSKNLQVIHLAGPGKLDTVKRCYQEKTENPMLLLESCQNMELLYSAADFVIARAGGSTVSELAYFGKYALLIPYPFAAELHQNDNAAWLCSAGGAEVLMNQDCSREKFRMIIDRWMEKCSDFCAAGEKNRTLAMPDAAKDVLAMIEAEL